MIKLQCKEKKRKNIKCTQVGIELDKKNDNVSSGPLPVTVSTAASVIVEVTTHQRSRLRSD